MRNLLFLIFSLTLIYELNADKKIRNVHDRLPSEWIIDCKEKKECVKKCVEMRVFQGHWGGDEYENTIRTECVRSCQQNTLCHKEEK